MICSSNEVVAALQKATLAAGANIGAANDIAAAGGWLCRCGLNGIDLVLQSIANGFATGSQPQIQPDSTSLDGASVVSAGPAALDLLQAGVTRQVNLLSCDCPVLLAGMAAQRALAEDQCWRLTDQKANTVLLGTESYSGDLATLLAAQDITIDMAAASARVDQHFQAPVAGAIDVDEHAWARVLSLAAARYVPSSEQSRTAGAGAGLLDND